MRASAYKFASHQQGMVSINGLHGGAMRTTEGAESGAEAQFDLLKWIHAPSHTALNFLRAKRAACRNAWG